MLNTLYCLFVEFITNIITLGFVAVFACVAVFAIAFLIDTVRIGKELKEEGADDGQADN